MKFAVFTTSTPEWTPAEAAQQLAAQGWDGIEWGINDFPSSATPSFRAGNRAVWSFERLEEELPEIGRVTKENGLEYSAIASYVLAHDRENIVRILRATAELGAGQVRIVAPHVRSRGYHELLKLAREDYTWIAARAEEYGVKALIEIHHRLITASVSGTMNLIRDLNPDHIGVIHDTGNLIIEGQEDYEWAFEQLGPYLAHVHVKNTVWKPQVELGPENTVLYAHEWAPLREGQANLPLYFESLVKVGYDGWVTVEDFTTALPLIERTADNLAYLRALEARALALPSTELCKVENDPMISSVRP